MKNLNKIVDVILLFPAVAWSINGIIDLFRNGLYSYTFLLPTHFKIHTFTLLPIATFYVTSFLIIKPHKPIKNFLISFSLLFLSTAVYEFVYAIFMSPHTSPNPPFGGVIASLPFVLGGILLLLFFNRRFHFLANDRKRIIHFLLGFSGLIAVLLILSYTGFFAQINPWLMGQTTNDPHNLLWILSKILCMWMFLPLLVFHSKPFRSVSGHS